MIVFFFFLQKRKQKSNLENCADLIDRQFIIFEISMIGAMSAMQFKARI